MAHAVRVEGFEGPIDLLLHLVTRRRVDIYDVSLAEIAADYLATIEAIPDLDLDGATGFLVVAASLLELKSARLLPNASAADPEPWLEERDLLLARLVECATFREAGSWLGARLDAGARLYPRAVALEERFADLRPPLGPVPVEDLLGAAGAVFAERPRPHVDTSHLGPIVASVRAAIAHVATELESRGAASFRDLCGRTTDRIDVVVRLLALLELFKAGAVELSQAERFGDIAARWTGQVGAEAALAGADEYVAEEPA